jgi:hypothetical protein
MKMSELLEILPTSIYEPLDPAIVKWMNLVRKSKLTVKTQEVVFQMFKRLTDANDTEACWRVAACCNMLSCELRNSDRYS